MTDQSPIGNIIQAYKTIFWYVLAFSVATNLLLFALPIFSLQVFDRVIASASGNTLLMLSIVVVIALICYGIIATARTLSLAAVNQWVDKYITPQLLRTSIINACQGQRVMMGRHIHNLSNVNNFVTTHAITFFFDAPWSLVFIAVIFYIHSVLGVIAVFGAIVIVALAYIYEVYTRNEILASDESYGRQITTADETVNNAEAVKALGMSHAAIDNFETEHKQFMSSQKTLSFRSSIILNILKVVRYILQVLITGFGVYYVIQSEITIGAVIASSILASRAFAPFDGAVMAWKSFVSARQSYEELVSSFSDTPAIDVKSTRPLPQGNLLLENVTYISPTTDKPIVKNISVNVGKGKVLGIIGPNASGKTTLAKLIAGIIQPTKGEVLLDNIDIFKATKSDFGQYLGYVPQHPQLFRTSVANNIARLQTSDDISENVMKAADIVGASDMILRMPEGYETNLGKEGHLLSAGQRQLISLARAFYGEPKILILDEPSTGLDYQGEIGLLKALKQAKTDGITTIIISHSKTILSYCDDIIQMQQGKIKHYGKAGEVLKLATAGKALR